MTVQRGKQGSEQEGEVVTAEEQVSNQLSSLYNSESSGNSESQDNMSFGDSGLNETPDIASKSMMKDAVEVTSVEGDLYLDVDFEEVLEDSQHIEGQYLEEQCLDLKVQGGARANQLSHQNDSVDIAVFFPSLLLSFENLLSRVFEDLLNGLKNHDLYSMGLAQYLKLEDEQVNGNAVKLRYRLPIDNLKYVFEAFAY